MGRVGEDEVFAKEVSVRAQTLAGGHLLTVPVWWPLRRSDRPLPVFSARLERSIADDRKTDRRR